MTVSIKKFSEGSTLERERMKSIFKLVVIKIGDNYDAEEVRFHQYVAPLINEIWA